MAKTKAELLADIQTLSHEIHEAQRWLGVYSRELQTAETDAKRAREHIEHHRAEIKRAETLLEITAAELTELNKTEGGR